MKNRFNALYFLSAQWRYFLIILLSAIILMAGYWKIILPLEHTLFLAKQQEMQINHQLQKLYTDEIFLSVTMAKIPQTKNALNEWQKKFIKYDDMGKLLKEILAMAKRNQLEVQSFRSDSDFLENKYIRRSFELSINGSCMHIAKFIEHIVHLPWTVIVENFSLAALSPDNASAELVLSVYSPARNTPDTYSGGTTLF
jgi:Tfp pilus assembly protein PilO